MSDRHVLSAQARTKLDAYLARPCGDGLSIYSHALDWARDPEYGGLPEASARAFANWLDNVWENWTEEPETTVGQIFESAVTEWCGGRVMPS